LLNEVPWRLLLVSAAVRFSVRGNSQQPQIPISIFIATSLFAIIIIIIVIIATTSWPSRWCLGDGIVGTAGSQKGLDPVDESWAAMKREKDRERHRESRVALRTPAVIRYYT